MARGDRRDPVAAPGDREHRDAHVGEVERPVGQREPPVGEVVGAEEAVVQLAERAPGIGVHVVHEHVDRLDLGEQLAVVQVWSAIVHGFITYLSMPASW